MADEISIKIEGWESLDRALGSFADATVNLTEHWAGVAKVFRSLNKKQFDSQGGLTGGWEKLSDAYAKRKAKVAPGKPIEEVSGALKRSLTEENDPNAISVPGPTSYIGGSILPYARAQHEGDERINLVARSLLGIETPEGAEEAAQALAEDLTAYAQTLGLNASITARGSLSGI